MEVVVDQAVSMNLLGLILASRLRRALQHPQGARRAAKLRGAYRIQAGEMSVFLRCEPERLTLMSECSDKIRAWVRGQFGAFVHVALGRGMVGPVLGGRVKFGGNPFALLRVVGLMTLDPDAGGTSGKA